MPRAGQILFCKDFVFSNKSTGDKLLIVLNTCNNEDTCLVLKTTSNDRYYNKCLSGCNPANKCYCIYPDCKQGFPVDTFVQLDYIYPINVNLLLDSKQITFVDRLTDICFSNLKRCLRNFKEDIPTGYWKSIYTSV